jgi:hypothetical protein
MILLVVLYRCETWSLTVREVCRLRVFEGRVLKRIFVPKMSGIIGGWGKLHSVDHNFVLRTKYYWSRDSSFGIMLVMGWMD